MEINKQRFTAESWAAFRTADLRELACSYAAAGDITSLRITFSDNLDLLLPFRFHLLSLIPPATRPERFKFLLPLLELNEEATRKGKAARGPDWVESEDLLNRLGIAERAARFDLQSVLRAWQRLNLPTNTTLHTFLFQDPRAEVAATSLKEGNIVEFPAKTQVSLLNAQFIRDWVLARARQLAETHPRHACELLQFERDSGLRGVDSLLGLLSDYAFLRECGDDSVLVDAFAAMSELDRLAVMLKDTSDLSFLEAFNGQPRRLIERSNDSNLLRSFLCELAPQSIEKVAAIIQQSKPTLPLAERVVKSNAELIDLALRCSYLAQLNPKTLQAINAIFGSLPAPTASMSPTETALQTDVDRLESLLELAEMFVRRGLPLPPTLEHVGQYVTDLAGKWRQLLDQLGRTKASAVAWQQLASDAETLRGRYFPQIDTADVQLHVFEIILRAGDVESAGRFLPPDKGSAAALVLRMGQEYVNSCSSANDPALTIARQTLLLLGTLALNPGSKDIGFSGVGLQIRQELDLVEAVSILGRYAFVIPLQVRLACVSQGTTLQFLTNFLEKHPKMDSREVVRIAALLSGIPYLTAVPAEAASMLLAERLLSQGQLTEGLMLCKDLVAKNYAPAWRLCGELAVESSTDQQDLLAFALQHCPETALPEYLTLWKSHQNYSALYDTVTPQELLGDPAKLIPRLSPLATAGPLDQWAEAPTLICHPFYGTNGESLPGQSAYSSKSLSSLLSHKHQRNDVLLQFFHFLMEAGASGSLPERSTEEEWTQAESLAVALSQKFTATDLPLALSFLWTLPDRRSTRRIFEHLFYANLVRPEDTERVCAYVLPDRSIASYFLSIQMLAEGGVLTEGDFYCGLPALATAVAALQDTEGSETIREFNRMGEYSELHRQLLSTPGLDQVPTPNNRMLSLP